MTTQISEVIRGWLGWCPNHPTSSVSPSKMNSGIYVIVVIGVIVLLGASVLLALSPSSQSVAVWAFRNDTGTMHFIARVSATEEATGKISFSPTSESAGSLPAGKYWLVIEHPDGDGSYKLMLDGDWVENQQGNPSVTTHNTKLFKIYGAGSLQKKDAYEALMAAFSDGERPMTGSGGVTECEYVVEK